MITFEVKDMTCGHCTSTITKAVHALDPSAIVQIDLPSHRVSIGSTRADATALSRVIVDAGYTPAATNADSALPAPPENKAGGCCCA